MDWHPIPCDFLMRCSRFQWISLDFRLISSGFSEFASASNGFLYDLWPLPMAFFGFSMDFFGFLWIGIQFHKISWWGVAASYGFLWIFDGFLWISVDSHPIPCDFFMRCGRFLWISFDFRWISLDFCGFASASNRFLSQRPETSITCQRRPSQSFTKAWRKRTSRMPGDFCVYGFCWNSLWLHQIINDSVWIIWIFIYFYWLPADFLQFPMMSCVFHIISALSYGFLSRSHGCPWII